MYKNLERGFGRKLCAERGPNQEKLYCSTFVGCCEDRCCSTEDLTFFFVWLAIALALVFLITCMICVFKKKQKNKTKVPGGKIKSQNMTNVFNVIVMNERKIFNPMMAGKAKRLEVKPLLRVSESSCGSDQQDIALPKTKV